MRISQRARAFELSDKGLVASDKCFEEGTTFSGNGRKRFSIQNRRVTAYPVKFQGKIYYFVDDQISLEYLEEKHQGRIVT